MHSREYREQLASHLRPVAPPIEIADVYTEDQRDRLLGVVRDHGLWKLIIAQHFPSPEALLATLSGVQQEGFTPTIDMFLSPTFRGFYANYSAALYPEIEDCFYNSKFLEYARSYWKAQYAKPQMMLFNINGPCANHDPSHLDTPSFRGIRYENAPTWLCSVMGKSGLFKDYLIKMAQVITWFSNDPTSGFTYWPEGPLKAPGRLQPPVQNRGVVVQNELMLHRGEANGPLDQRFPNGLAFHSLFGGAPRDAECDPDCQPVARVCQLDKGDLCAAFICDRCGRNLPGVKTREQHCQLCCGLVHPVGPVSTGCPDNLYGTCIIIFVDQPFQHMDAVGLMAEIGRIVDIDPDLWL